MVKLSHAGLWVHDQDDALAFYTDKLGMEIRDDVTFPELGGFRWLTVGPPAQPEIAIALITVPGPPVFDADTAEQLKALVAKGVVGGIFFSTDDCQGDYEELKSRGVEFQQQPEQRPYGLDAGFRDPSGNEFRMVQTSSA